MNLLQFTASENGRPWLNQQFSILRNDHAVLMTISALMVRRSGMSTRSAYLPGAIPPSIPSSLKMFGHIQRRHLDGKNRIKACIHGSLDHMFQIALPQQIPGISAVRDQRGPSEIKAHVLYPGDSLELLSNAAFPDHGTKTEPELFNHFLGADRFMARGNAVVQIRGKAPAATACCVSFRGFPQDQRLCRQAAKLVSLRRTSCQNPSPTPRMSSLLRSSSNWVSVGALAAASLLKVTEGGTVEKILMAWSFRVSRYSMSPCSLEER